MKTRDDIPEPDSKKHKLRCTFLSLRPDFRNVKGKKNTQGKDKDKIWPCIAFKDNSSCCHQENKQTDKKNVFQYKKTTLRKGENICKQSNGQGTNF